MLTYWQLDHWKRSSAKLAPNTDENQFENNVCKNFCAALKSLTWVSTLLIILTTNKLFSHWIWKGDRFVVFKPQNIFKSHFDSRSHWDAMTIFQCELSFWWANGWCHLDERKNYKLIKTETYCYQSPVFQHSPFISSTYMNISLILTHWDRDKMAAIFQTTFSNAFPWRKMVEFRLKFNWSLFPRVQLTIF